MPNGEIGVYKHEVWQRYETGPAAAVLSMVLKFRSLYTLALFSRQADPFMLLLLTHRLYSQLFKCVHNCSSHFFLHFLHMP